MKKSNSIFLLIIMVLLVVVGFLTYYTFYWKDGYTKSTTSMVEFLEILEDAGVEVRSIDNSSSQVIVKQQNKVIMEESNQ